MAMAKTELPGGGALLSQNTASTSSTAPVKKEKAKYELPGQTKPTPDETDSLRRFYVSLLEQKPTSRMAEDWCLRHGLLPGDRAAKLAKKKKATSVVLKPKTEKKREGEVEKAKTAGKKTTVPMVKKREEEAKEKEKPKKRNAAATGAARKKARGRAHDDDSDDDRPLALRA